MAYIKITSTFTSSSVFLTLEPLACLIKEQAISLTLMHSLKKKPKKNLFI